MSDRNILTVFFFRGAEVKRIRSKYPNMAVERAMGRLAMNIHGATAAQVYEEDTGIVHADLTHRIGSNKVESTYKRDPLAFETRYSLTHLLDAAEEEETKKGNKK